MVKFHIKHFDQTFESNIRYALSFSHVYHQNGKNHISTKLRNESQQIKF